MTRKKVPAYVVTPTDHYSLASISAVVHGTSSVKRGLQIKKYNLRLKRKFNLRLKLQAPSLKQQATLDNGSGIM